MSTEIFAFIQAQVNTQVQPAINSKGAENSDVQPGLFDSLITELTENSVEQIGELETVLPEFIEQSTEPAPQVLTFNSKGSFNMSVIDLLADVKVNVEKTPGGLPEDLGTELKNLFTTIKSSFDENPIEQAEIFGTENIDDINQVISQLLSDNNDEAINDILATLPEETQQEIQSLINEIKDSLENANPDVQEPLMTLVSTLAKHDVIKPADDKNIALDSDSQTDDNDDEQEISDTDVNVNVAAASVTPVYTPEINNSQPALVKNDNAENSQQVIQPQYATKNVQREVKAKTDNNVALEPENDEAENVKPESNFREVFEARNREHENQGQQNFDDSQHDNENQGQEFFSRDRNSSRTRNSNDRRVTTANNDTSRSTTTTSHRTDSRNDFSSFFEGVLNNRRSVSQTSPSPLNLRTNINFTQSETLRDGLVNVVRFIRADGVQKASVVIDPPALGRISVELTSGTSGMEASIKVASEQIRQLIQDQISQLRMNLSQQGVQVAEFTVDVQQDNQQSGQHSQDDNQNQRRTAILGGVEDEDTEEFRVDLEDGLLYWVA